MNDYIHSCRNAQMARRTCGVEYGTSSSYQTGIRIFPADAEILIMSKPQKMLTVSLRIEHTSMLIISVPNLVLRVEYDCSLGSSKSSPAVCMLLMLTPCTMLHGDAVELDTDRLGKGPGRGAVWRYSCVNFGGSEGCRWNCVCSRHRLLHSTYKRCAIRCRMESTEDGIVVVNVCVSRLQGPVRSMQAGH
ncbi:hypothetical protein PILCRDRAFT_656755 [Piloderma croceum F 1598]|uniref:Uncharacterized protein n=1 Tax=Piloderma croceum (strain F 1598) TaxID=765440 RepID=A0A0C3EU46_PILCF|nr:hypothetical protein PILCRDRAFT_656755 [Piloderma croceum F 1598]